MFTRPVPKELLKKMFLKTLWQHRPGGKHASSGGSVGGILATTLPFEFQLPNSNPHLLYTKWALTEEDRQDALLGVEELQRDGFIRNDPNSSSPDFKVLTPKGERQVEKKLEELKLPSVNLEQLLSHEDLLDLVRDDYLNEKYDAAIRAAFLQVEEAVRKKAKQSAGVTGHDLMVAAFAPARGVLKHPEAQTAAEDQAFFVLFDGANGWFRNPTAHRTVGYIDPNQVAQILGLANLLLDMVDKCVPR
jgi:uncharacterized protein (TIGR02391 family)